MEKRVGLRQKSCGRKAFSTFYNKIVKEAATGRLKGR